MIEISNVGTNVVMQYILEENVCTKFLETLKGPFLFLHPPYKISIHQIIRYVKSLEGGVGVGQELLKVSLKPSSSFWSRLESCSSAAGSIVSDCGGVGSSLCQVNFMLLLSRIFRTHIALSTWLDPDKSVLDGGSGVCCWADTESSTLDVAPVSPCLLAGRLLSIASCIMLENVCICQRFTKLTSVGDEVGWEACSSEKRSELGDVSKLVAVCLALSVRRACSDAPGIVVCNIGGQTPDLRGAASCLVKISKHGCSRANIGGPSKPSSVTSIEIHGNVRKVELLNSVGCAFLICSSCVGALGDIQVGDKVSKGIGFLMKSAVCRIKLSGDYVPMTRMTLTSE